MPRSSTAKQIDFCHHEVADAAAHGRLPSWFPEAASRLNAILKLPENWNSYGAVKIRKEAASNAMRLMRWPMIVKVAFPAIVPVPTGNIQLEWHESGIDLEIEIAPDGFFSISYEDTTGQTKAHNDEHPRHSINDPNPLNEYLNELACRTDAKRQESARHPTKDEPAHGLVVGDKTSDLPSWHGGTTTVDIANREALGNVMENN